MTLEGKEVGRTFIVIFLFHTLITIACVFAFIEVSGPTPQK